MPWPALANTLASVALRTSRGSRPKSSPASTLRPKAYRKSLASSRRYRTRSTQPGERLVRTIRRPLKGIEAELASLTELRDKPAGTIRITAGEHAAHTVLWPAVAKLVPDYPDINVEIVIDHALRDIVAERYDAG